MRMLSLLVVVLLVTLCALAFAAKCPQCGQDVPEGAQFCPHCGAKLEPPAAPPNAGVILDPLDHDNGKWPGGEGWAFQNGALHVRSGGVSGAYQFRDGLAQIETEHVSGDLAQGYGLAFRMASRPGGWGGYGLYITVDGTWNLSKVSAEKWSDLTPSAHSDALHTGEGAKNTVGVVCRGAEITVLINGRRIATVKDSEFADGGVGPAGAEKADIAFRNLKIDPNYHVEPVVPAPAPGPGAANPWEQPGTGAGEEIVGPDGGKMVWVPAGEFDMGSAEGEGDPDEHPQHHVRISKGFWLGKCTVTLGQWKAYCQKKGIQMGTAGAPADDHPVTNVTWVEAQAYCAAYGLALPTEAQWEYAARGPEGRKYPWGNAWDEDKCCNEGNKGPGGRTFPVGSFPAGASWCGALDMAGNVFQWCKDWYDANYYVNSPDTDPPGPDTGEYRLLRGGSWVGYPGDCRSAFRLGRVVPDVWLSFRGFGLRVARTP